MMFEFTHGPDVVDDLIQHWLLSHQIGPVSSTKTSQISPDLFLIFFFFFFFSSDLFLILLHVLASKTWKVINVALVIYLELLS